MDTDFKKLKAISQWRFITLKAIQKAIYHKIRFNFQKQIDELIKAHYALHNIGAQPFVIYRGEVLYFQNKECFVRRLSGKKSLYTLDNSLVPEMRKVMLELDKALASVNQHRVSNYLQQAVSHSNSEHDLKQLIPKMLHEHIAHCSVSDGVPEETLKSFKEKYSEEYKLLEEQLVMNMILG